jgi:hypothetical protein
MNRIRRITVMLAAFATAVLAFTAASPAALAVRVPPPGGTAGPASGLTRSVPWPKTTAVPTPPQVHTVVIGGMPGWQITLIAAAAALLAAVVAVSLDRARASRRHMSAPSA